MISVDVMNTPGHNKYTTLMGIKFVEIAEGRAVGEVEVRDDHFHPGMIVHGGVAFSLLDSLMAMATLSTCERGQNASTIECKISYMAPVTEGVMRGEARIVKRGRKVVFLEGNVNVGDKLIATATATFMIVDLKS